LTVCAWGACNGDKAERLRQRADDSIQSVGQVREDRRIDSFSNNLGAIRFSGLHNLKFSIDFDTIINKTVLLENFTLIDIQHLDGRYVAKVSLNDFHYVVNLNIKKEDIEELRLNEADDFDSGHFLLANFSDVSIPEVNLEGEFHRQKVNNFCVATRKEMPLAFVFKINGALLKIIKRDYQ
jgi:hypothetical protein